MKPVEWGAMIAVRRREAGLTQAGLAERMSTAQSAISRVEAGRTLPSVAFLERFARATGRPLTVVFGEELAPRSRQARRDRVRQVLGSYRFNPWERGPTEAEARTLIADGLTRERFEGPKAASWTAAEYHETDLDLCAPLTRGDRATLGGLGFRPEGRHWTHPKINIAVEFPDSRIDGDEARTVEAPTGPGSARIIGLDDLYIDRLRQSTIDERREGVEFQSALAVVAARYEDIDWPYVRRRIEEISESEGRLGDSMKRLDSRIRRRVRASLGRPRLP